MFSGMSIGLRIFIGGALTFVVGFVALVSGICEVAGIEFKGMIHGGLYMAIPAMLIGLGVMFFTYKALFDES
jgi:hypothetical protein